MWGAVIWCLTELALGYMQSQSHDSQDQNNFYFQKLQDIQDNLRRLSDEMQSIKADIKRAVEMINREIHEALMLDHFSEMESNATLILGNFQQLNKMANTNPDQNNLNNEQVHTWVNELTSHRDKLFASVNAFARQDGGALGRNPTLQTFVCCAPSIALWAKAYQLIDSYNPVASQIPVYQHAVSQQYKALLSGFFSDAEQWVTNDRSQLTGQFLTPGNHLEDGKLLKFRDHHFVYSDIPSQAEYPGEAEYEDLYYWQYWGSSQAPSGLWGTKREGDKCVWRRTPKTDDAHQTCLRLLQASDSISSRFRIYEPIVAKANSVMGLFERPTFSDRVSLPMRGSFTREGPPSFYISVSNEGPEGTVIVTEYINENEHTEVFRKLMRRNETVDNVECVGTGYKRFHWKNVGSGNEGDAEKGDGLTLHVDPQGLPGKRP